MLSQILSATTKVFVDTKNYHEDLKNGERMILPV